MLTRNEQMINDLLVGLFNNILVIEQQALKNVSDIPLSITEIHVLEAIQKENNPTMSRVAKRLLVTVGTLTTSIKRLIEKGFVQRQIDPNDRRIVNLSLTKQGLDVCKIHDQFHIKMIETIREETDFLEDEILMESLEKVKMFFTRYQEMHLNDK